MCQFKSGIQERMTAIQTSWNLSVSRTTTSEHLRRLYERNWFPKIMSGGSAQKNTQKNGRLWLTRILCQNGFAEKNQKKNSGRLSVLGGSLMYL